MAIRMRMRIKGVQVLLCERKKGADSLKTYSIASRKVQPEPQAGKEARQSKVVIPESAPIYSVRLEAKHRKARDSFLTAALQVAGLPAIVSQTPDCSVKLHLNSPSLGIIHFVDCPLGLLNCQYWAGGI